MFSIKDRLGCPSWNRVISRNVHVFWAYSNKCIYSASHRPIRDDHLTSKKSQLRCYSVFGYDCTHWCELSGWSTRFVQLTVGKNKLRAFILTHRGCSRVYRSNKGSQSLSPHSLLSDALRSTTLIDSEQLSDTDNSVKLILHSNSLKWLGVTHHTWVLHRLPSFRIRPQGFQILTAFRRAFIFMMTSSQPDLHRKTIEDVETDVLQACVIIIPTRKAN